jgi:phosphatidylglycerol---prolipoprotein diacylglyceryl transferase
VLPVLLTVIIPARWGLPGAVALAVLVALARALALVRATRGEKDAVSFLGALRADGWLLAALAAAVLIARRAGVLDGELRLPLHTYGLLLAAAFLVGVLLAQREARRRGQEPERIGELAFWILVASVAGSMVFYLFLNLGEFTGPRFWADPPLQHLPRFLIVWRVGLVFYGGFIGALLVSVWYMRRHGMPFLAYADTLIPSVAFGHFLGRLGCFAAGCCWGSLADEHLPWAARFPPGSNVYEAFAASPDYGARFFSLDRLTTAPLHPAQLYEALGELGIFLGLVLLVRPRKGFHGQVLATWLLAYAVLRGGLELFRGDLARHTWAGLNSGQWTSVAILALGALVWLGAPRPSVEPAAV